MHVHNSKQSVDPFSDEEAISAIDPRPVLAALALKTGDRSFLADEFRQSPDPDVDAERISAARDFLRKRLGNIVNGPLRADELRTIEPIPEEEVVQFLTNGAGEAYADFISEQLRGGVQAGDHFGKKVAIVGGGLSGIAAAIKFISSGCTVVIYEKNHEIGGTWAYNDYPGCRLDTNNFTYTYSFSRARKWTNYYSTQPEVLEYLKQVARRHGVDEFVELDAQVLQCSWSEEDQDWTLSIEKNGAVSHARFDIVISALGQLGVPKIPQFAGLEDFHGLKIHSNRWPKDLDLSGKKVGVIGTGATGFQLAPELAKRADKLVIFQRNPPWLMPTPEYSRAMPQGAVTLFETLPGLSDWYRFWQFWISVEGRLPLTEVDQDWREKGSVSKRNQEFRQMLTNHLVRQFSDRPDLLAKVIPSYPPGAKRMLRDDGTWATMLKRPNVRLETSGINSFVSSGVKLETSEVIDLDVVVFASGFAASDYLPDITVTGRDGREIHEVWGDEPRAYMGAMVPGFPNFFMLYGPNTNLVVNGSIMFMSECSINFVAKCLELLQRSNAVTVEVTDEAYRRFIQEMDEGNSRRAWSVVSNFYQNGTGKVTQVWPHTLLEFWQRTRSVNHDDVMMGA